MKETQSPFEFNIVDNDQATQKSITCLGMTFANDEERRNYFTAKLREKLQEPAFRQIEGFPIGEDEDILALSDPPYYTACPNPWIADFIAEWEAQRKPTLSGVEEYYREPFAADVSEGKQNPIYNIHSYHTKVPHKAIMRYILHYTAPGDIVFDGFCGTGMTGVAAQLCGDRNEVISLGYQIKPDGTILQEEIDQNDKKVWKPFSKLGVRKVILNDLSPAATFIAHNYNSPVDIISFEKETKRILSEVERECAWMYETRHTDGRIGQINFTIWSDVFLCNNCSEEIIFWQEAIDKKTAVVLDLFPCPSCGADLSKRSMSRAWITKFDPEIKQAIKQAKQIPVLLNYSIDGSSERYEKEPDQLDLGILEKIENLSIEEWYPSDQIPKGDKTGEPISIGTTHVHHFYTKRNLKALAYVHNQIRTSQIRFLFTGFLNGATKLNQLHLKYYVFGGGGCNPGPRKGVIYSPSISLENPIPKLMLDRFRTQLRGFALLADSTNGHSLTTVGSASTLDDNNQGSIWIARSY